MGLCNDNTKKPQLEDTQVGLQQFRHFARKFSKGSWVQERALVGLCICLCEYTQKVNFKIHLPLKVPAT